MGHLSVAKRVFTASFLGKLQERHSLECSPAEEWHEFGDGQATTVCHRGSGNDIGYAVDEPEVAAAPGQTAIRSARRPATM
jgi:hypothetical protein